MFPFLVINKLDLGFILGFLDDWKKLLFSFIIFPKQEEKLIKHFYLQRILLLRKKNKTCNDSLLFSLIKFLGELVHG